MGARDRARHVGRLRGAADVPRVRAHALPHLRDEHGRPARAVPEVRSRARAQGRDASGRRRSSPPCRRSTIGSPRRPPPRACSLRGIRIAISGAMPLSADVVEPWEAATGGYLVEGYGLSECSPVLMANPVAPNRRAGTVGLPLPDTEVPRGRPRGARRATSRRAPRASSSCAARRCSQGYWKKPDETAAVFVDDPAAAPLVPHGRHRLDRRRGLRAHRRPHQGADHHGRLQRRPERGRGGAAAPPRRRRRRGRGPARRALGRAGRRGRRARPGAALDARASARSRASTSPPTRCPSASSRPTTCRARSSAR